jgi:outer membrane receptor for monomeric catechols
MAGARHRYPITRLASITRLGLSVVLGVALAGAAAAQTAPANAPAPPPAAAAEEPTAQEAPATRSSPDSPSDDAARPPASDTMTVTGDGKTTVPRGVMREQSDFRLNEALRNVPGINRR